MIWWCCVRAYGGDIEGDSDRSCGIAVAPERGKDGSGGCPGKKFSLPGFTVQVARISKTGKTFPLIRPSKASSYQTVTKKLTTKGAFDRLWALSFGPLNLGYFSARRGSCERECGSDVGGRT
jgi:hypothetical protein